MEKEVIRDLQSAHNEYDMLKGCINRLFVTDSKEELFRLYHSAIVYLTKIHQYHYIRLEYPESQEDPPGGAAT